MNRITLTRNCLFRSPLNFKLRLWKVLNLWLEMPTYVSVGHYRIFTQYMNPRHHVRGGGSPTERYKHVWWRLFKVADKKPLGWVETLKKDCAGFAYCPACRFHFWPEGEDLSHHYEHRKRWQ